jgi:hypothetical protein
MGSANKEVGLLIGKLARENGIGVGDVITKLTKFFGIAPCASCEKRRQVFNQLRIVGLKIKWEDIRDL